MRWPEARAVSDPGQVLYAAFGLERASPGWIAGPRVWWPGLKALLAGHGVGRVIGDPRQRTGAFLVRDGAIVWRYLHEHSGAPSRWDEVGRLARDS